MRAADPRLRLAGALLVVLWLVADRAAAQAIPTDGRVSLFWNWSQRKPDDGESSSYSELITRISLASNPRSDSTFEYNFDLRWATSPESERRAERFSLYDAWVGVRDQTDRWSLRLGQMWLHELGGLGSVAGLFGEYRSPRPSPIGRFRFGVFGGREAKVFDTGFVEGITKGGAFVAVDADDGRRHSLGWVVVRNQDLTERSVVVFNNYIPVQRKIFLYQAMNYDTLGPAGLGNDALTYLFTNIRVLFTRSVELQVLYHQGRSIDTRSITEDMLAGRPVDPSKLDGLLFESARTRLSVRPWRRVRLWGSYGRDRTNRDDEWNDRTEIGFSIVDVARIGVDVTLATSRIERTSGSYDTTYASLGKTIGRRAYLSFDYATSISVYSYRRSDGGTIETRPESKRLALNVSVNLDRTFSLIATGEHVEYDGSSEIHVLTGLTVRF